MRVLVTGASGPAGRTLLDQLHGRGVTAMGVDLAPQERADGVAVVQVLPASHSRHLDELRTIAADFGADLVIPTVSEELPTVAAADIPGAVIASPAAVELANDKWLTATVLAHAGVATPRTANGGDLSPALLEWVGHPFVTKPRISRGGRGVVIHRDRWQAVGIDQSLLISEFVPGTEYGPNVFVADDPSDDVAVVLRKTGLKSGDHGNATGVVRVVEPEIGRLALAACRALGLSGPADVDIRRRSDGTPVVLEVNARFGANSAHAPAILGAVLSRVAVSA